MTQTSSTEPSVTEPSVTEPSVTGERADGVVTVAVRGSGSLAELVRRRIGDRADLARDPNDRLAEAAVRADVLVYLPEPTELTRRVGTTAAKLVTGWLADGVDVVSTIPVDLLNREKLLAACRSGGTTFHGTGGLSTALPVRFSRAFAAITRDIESVALVEHRQPGEPDAARAASAEAARNLLAEAAFGSVESGQHAGYAVLDDAERPIPLRYELRTVTSDATARCTVEFHGVDPAEPIAAKALLAAIVPVHTSAPGILHHELDINQVRPDDRLAR